MTFELTENWHERYASWPFGLRGRDDGSGLRSYCASGSPTVGWRTAPLARVVATRAATTRPSALWLCRCGTTSGATAAASSSSSSPTGCHLLRSPSGRVCVTAHLCRSPIGIIGLNIATPLNARKLPFRNAWIAAIGFVTNDGFSP